MAYGAEPAGADPSAHTIYIWPSRELTTRSWHWPESWHVAFEQAASQIGRAAAVCVMGGLPVSEHPIAIELSTGRITFSVRLRGTGAYIAIMEFEGPEQGPNSPGPDGGCQPRAVDGLVLGLRGSGKCFCLVTFYGYLSPLPAGYGVSAGLNSPVSDAESELCRHGWRPKASDLLSQMARAEIVPPG